MKKQKIYIEIVAILVIGMATIFLFSCKKDTIQNNQTTLVTQQSLPSVVSFSTNIAPIFASYCNSSGCHSATVPASGLNLTATSAYNSLMSKHETYTVNPSGSNLYIEVTNGNMPKPPAPSISSYDQQLILKWITQGANNN